MDDKTINEKKVVGDWNTVSKITGKSTEACRQAWSRKEGKSYEEVKAALISVIDHRNNLVNQYN